MKMARIKYWVCSGVCMGLYIVDDVHIIGNELSIVETLLLTSEEEAKQTAFILLVHNFCNCMNVNNSHAGKHEQSLPHLRYMDNPEMLVDRNVNPKVSDVYNLFKNLI